MSESGVLLLLLTIATVLFATATARYRYLWRRAARQLEEVLQHSSSRRPDDALVDAVDSIGIEVDRLAEGQRYLTRVLAERPAAASTRAPSKPDTA